jgi:osmotically-inducible protein OsmY
MRTLFRLIVLLIVIAFIGGWLLGYSPANLPFANWRTTTPASSADKGTVTIDTSKARERGAEIGEKAAVATRKLQETVSEATLTGKIKAKMALDDTLKARTIDVTTTGSTVTVSGRVPSRAAHDRALALARETSGVSTVVDRLEVVPGS